MAIKVIMRFNGFTEAAPPRANIGYTGAQHAFGFSETFWDTVRTQAEITAWLNGSFGLGASRCACLPSNVTFVDALLYTSEGGRGIPVPVGRAGVQPVSDQANVALLLSTRHPTAPAQRKFWLHCLPDSWVQGGEFTPTSTQTQQLYFYLLALGSTQWLGLVRNDLRDVITITANGLVSLPGANPYSVGQLLRVNRTLTADKKLRGAQKFVSSIGPGSNQFTLGEWTLGATTGGKIFRPTYEFYTMGTGGVPIVERAGTKRVGRPFDLYRGRQPARR